MSLWAWIAIAAVVWGAAVFLACVLGPAAALGDQLEPIHGPGEQPGSFGPRSQMVPQMAGIVAVLTRGGLSAGAIHHYLRQPRPELGGMTPRQALFAGAASDVLELARDEAARWAEWTP